VTFLDLARRRRSIRRYAARPVPREALDRCCEAARLAPSACHSQPWRFVVVDGAAEREALFRAAFGGPLCGFNRFAAQAPVLVAVVTGRSKWYTRVGGLLRGLHYALVDVGIAAEHFVLQATEEGLGTCWLGWFDGRAARRALGLPRGTRIDVILAVGYPEGDPPADKPRKPLDAIREFLPRRCDVTPARGRAGAAARAP
jgi:nitroreductase